MAFNVRETDFINGTKQLATEIFDVIQKSERFRKKFTAEFQTGQANALSEHTTDLAAIGLTYTVFNTFFNQVCEELKDFRDGAAVAERDRNTDIVEIMN